MIIEIPDNCHSLKEKIDYIREQEPEIEMPMRLKPPRPYVFPRIHDLDAITNYANSLLQYVAEKKKYDADYEAAKKLYDAAKPIRLGIAHQIQKLIKDETGLTALPVSENKKEKIWDKAWMDTDNESEAIENLRELVELLED